MEFSAQLVQAMSKCDIKASELSRRSGVSKPSISQYLSGGVEPSESTRQKLETVLRITREKKPDFEEQDKPFKFSPNPINPREAAKLMRMSESRLIDMMESGEISIGHVYRSESGGKRRIYISPKLFYEYTGWRE